MTTPRGPYDGPRHAPQPDPRQPDTRQAGARQQPVYQPPPAPAAAPRDSGAVFALRITTYVLTSLASLVFLAMVVYGYVALQDLRNSLASNPLFGGGIPSSSLTAPGLGDTGLDVGDNYANLCADNPGAPECNGN